MVSFYCGIVAASLTGPAPWQDNRYPQIDSGEPNILQDTGAKGARWNLFRVATLHGHPIWKQYLAKHGVVESVRRQQCTDWIAVRLDCTPGSASKRWAWSTKLLQPRFNRAEMSRDLHSICGKVGNQQPHLPGECQSPVKKFYGQWLRSGGQRKNCGGRKTYVNYTSGMQGFSLNCKQQGWQYDQVDLSARDGKWAAICQKTCRRMQSNTKKIAADPEWHSTHPRGVSCFLGTADTACPTWAGQDFPPVPWWKGKFLTLAMTKNVVLLTVPWHKPVHTFPGSRRAALFPWLFVWTLWSPGSHREVQNRGPSHRVFARRSDCNGWTIIGAILHLLAMLWMWIRHWIWWTKELPVVIQMCPTVGEWQHRKQFDQSPPIPANHPRKSVAGRLVVARPLSLPLALQACVSPVTGLKCMSGFCGNRPLGLHPVTVCKNV